MPDEYPWETETRLGDEALAVRKKMADALVEEWNEEPMTTNTEREE